MEPLGRAAKIARFLALLSVFSGGCTLIYNASDLSVGGPVDAGANEDAGLDASLADPCAHARPAARPDAASEAESAPALTFALSHLALVAGNGDTVGFDLDGVCTCDERPAAARGGAPSCAPRRADQPLCDNAEGRDNAAAAVLAKLVPDRVDAGVDVGFDFGVTEGAGSVLVELDEYNGRESDPAVLVAFYDSPGLAPPMPCAAGVVGDAGVNGDGKPKPDWGGCDRWMLGEGGLLAGGPRTFTRDAWVANGSVVARFTSLAIRIGGADVLVYDAVVSATLERAPPALPRLRHGVIAGRVLGDDLLRVFSEQVVLERPLCHDPLSLAIFRAAACDTLDLGSSADASAPCDSISLTVEFAGGVAQKGPTAPSARVVSLCADAGAPPTCR